ncbi:MAG: tetratricopeptide repeat protein [candidate division Zixibacteria bacterium]|nr:tetratricopeptide repeat protein [candidate division Zixibacteria bacterium]
MKKILFISIITIVFCNSITFAQNFAWGTTAFRNDPELKYAHELIQKGHYEKAISFLLEVYAERKETGHNYTVNMLVRAFQDSKQNQMLKDFSQEYRNDFPDSLRGYLITAKSLFFEAQDEEADKVLRKAMEVVADSEMKYREIAGEYLRGGIMQGAIETYKSGRKKMKMPYGFCLDLANIYEAQGLYGFAAREYVRFTADKPLRVSIPKSRIKSLIENTTDPDEIIDALESEAKELPDNDSKLLVLCDAYRQTGKHEKALRSYIEYEKAVNSKGKKLISFLVECIADENYDVAIKGAEYIIDEYGSKSRDYWRACAIIAESYYGKGDEKQARKTFLEIIDKSPSDNSRITSYMQLGDIEFNNNNFSEAENYFNIILSKYPSYPHANYALTYLGDIQLYNENFDSAVVLYSSVKYTGSNPYEAEVMNSLAETEFFRGNYQIALLNCKKYIFDYPAGDHANDCLIMMDIIFQCESDSATLSEFAEAGYNFRIRNYDEAKSMYEGLLNMQSNDILRQAGYLKLLDIYLVVEDFKKAVKRMEAFEEMFPESYYIPYVLLKLGSTYKSNLKDFDRASKVFADLIKRFPESMVVDNARNRLKSITPAGNM